MIVVLFHAVNQEVQYGRYTYHSSAPDACFDALSDLVSKGWQLFGVRYGHVENGKLSWIDLPVEAFDSQPIKASLVSLQKEWEQLLGYYQTGLS